MILVIAAMQSEVDDIMKKHRFQSIDAIEHLYQLMDDTHEVLIKITGVGKVNAAYGLTSVIDRYPITSIYNIGLAGASNKYHQSDVVLIEQALYHDFDLSMFGQAKGQVPGCPARFQSDLHLMDAIKDRMDLKKSTLYTGDVFLTQSMADDFVVDMEGAALYHVAYKKRIPMVAIKVVSDIIGMDEHLASYQSFEIDKGSIILNEVFEKIVWEVKR